MFLQISCIPKFNIFLCCLYNFIKSIFHCIYCFLIHIPQLLYPIMEELLKCSSSNTLNFFLIQLFHPHVILQQAQEILRNTLFPMFPITDCPLQRIRLVCIDENGQYSSTDSFKYCSRIDYTP